MTLGNAVPYRIYFALMPHARHKLAAALIIVILTLGARLTMQPYIWALLGS